MLRRSRSKKRGSKQARLSPSRWCSGACVERRGAKEALGTSARPARIGATIFDFVLVALVWAVLFRWGASFHLPLRGDYLAAGRLRSGELGDVGDSSAQRR